MCIRDSNSGFDFNTFSSLSILNNSPSTFLESINTDTVSSCADLDYEVCVADGDSYRVFFSTGSCNSVSSIVNFSFGDSAPSFTQMLDFPTEICLGEEIEIINTHTGIFEGIAILSGDMLAIPICNNIEVCDTITVSPSITTTYKILSLIHI